MPTTRITLIANLAADPDLRFTPAGKAYCHLRAASTPSHRAPDGQGWEDGETLWVDVTCFGGLAEQAADRLQKGHQIICEGRLEARTWTGSDGATRTSLDLTADTVGLCLPRRSPSQSNPVAQRPATSGPAPAPVADPWAQPGGAEPPF